MADKNLVHQNGEKLFVTSLDISNRFGKRHDNVLRDIETLGCSPEFRRLNFEEITYNDGRQRLQRAFNITRDGFVFLCMGFTGPQAALWKERYITAFNQMEATLRAKAPTPAPAPALALPGLKMTRQKERVALEMFVAGSNTEEIRKHIGVSRSTVSLVIHGKYQFAPGAGAPECSFELIAAVAARHLAVEQERLAAMQERTAQRYLSTANNQALASALEQVGRQLQQAPMVALGLPKGGA